MRLCVLDASFAMAWVFADEANAAADALLDRLAGADSVVVPAVLWSLEVRNVLRNAVRRSRLSAELAEQHRRALRDLPKVVVACPNGLGAEIDELVRAHGLNSYDAAYLALAVEHDLPLATAAAGLAAAAQAAGVRRYAG
ncbi:MAG: type II toxin-antitoxin system VapC family toxin [Planctomycetes bacterium]|nr:type II toxin-antitoxin system VapC family toxin [Planctomycetota bacterium]